MWWWWVIRNLRTLGIWADESTSLPPPPTGTPSSPLLGRQHGERAKAKQPWQARQARFPKTNKSHPSRRNNNSRYGNAKKEEEYSDRALQRLRMRGLLRD